MSRPSVLHEERLRLLEDLAHLAGYTTEVDLHAGLRPDVVRLHQSARSLLLADAKATEDPRDFATRARLQRYAFAANAWVAVGVDVAFAVCHGPDPGRRWLSLATTVASTAGHPVRTTRYTYLDEDNAVTWVAFR